MTTCLSNARTCGHFQLLIHNHVMKYFASALLATLLLGHATVMAQDVPQTQLQRTRLTAGIHQIDAQVAVTTQEHATGQVFDLAINAGPVAGIVGVEVDADRHAAGPTRDDGINVAQAGTVAAVIVCGEHGALYNPRPPC